MMNDELNCNKCGEALYCRAGRSAHRSNWYCPSCDRPQPAGALTERPLWSDTHSVEQLLDTAPEKYADAIYNLHEDLLCLKEVVATLSRPQPVGECGELVRILRHRVKILEKSHYCEGFNCQTCLDRGIQIDLLTKSIAALSRPQSGVVVSRSKAQKLRTILDSGDDIYYDHDWCCELLSELTKALEKDNDR